MKKLFTIALCICTSLMAYSQEQNSSEVRMKSYSERIEEIIRQEKKNIKKELDAVDKDFENKLISKEEKVKKREEIATKYEKIINDKVDSEKLSLEDFTKEKVKNAVMGRSERSGIELKSFQEDGNAFLNVNYKSSNSRIELLKNKYEIISSVGFVNLLSNSGSLNYSDKDSKIRYGKSNSLNLGFGYTKQIGGLASPVFLRTGLDYRNIILHPDKPLIWKQNSQQLYLEEFQGGNLKRSNLSSHYFLIPVDFKFVVNPNYVDENGQKILDYSRPKLILGVGIYGGARFLTQSYVVCKNEDNIRVKYRENVNDKLNNFVFGAKFSAGYKGFNLYIKKDFTSIFKNNTAMDNKYAMEIGIDAVSIIF